MEEASVAAPLCKALRCNVGKIAVPLLDPFRDPKNGPARNPEIIYLFFAGPWRRKTDPLPPFGQTFAVTSFILIAWHQKSLISKFPIFAGGRVAHFNGRSIRRSTSLQSFVGKIAVPLLDPFRDPKNGPARNHKQKLYIYSCRTISGAVKRTHF